MKLTLIRTDRETGKESFSTLEAENLIAKIKKENKQRMYQPCAISSPYCKEPIITTRT